MKPQPCSRIVARLSTLAAAIALAAAAVAALPPAELAVEARIWRVAIADGKSPTIRIWDVEEQEQVAVLTTGGPAILSHGLTEMSFSAVQPKAGQVQMLDLGLKREDHGDHQHWVAGKPSLSAVIATGQRPSHANPGADKLAVFFDGEGVVKVLATASFSAAGQIKTDRPHHGLAVPLPLNRYLVSAPAADGSLPEAVNLVDSDGKILQRSPQCFRMHGDADQAPWYVFGCANGVLIWNDGALDGKGQFSLLPYPANSGERSVRTLLETPKKSFFVGSFGPDGLLVIDPEAAATQPLVPIALPTKMLHFARDSADPQTVVALLRTGELLVVDTRSAQIVRRTHVLFAWDDAAVEAEKRLPRPQVAVAHGRIVVSDARTGLLHVLRTSDLKETGRLAVGGQPASLALRSVDLDAD